METANHDQSGIRPLNPEAPLDYENRDGNYWQAVHSLYQAAFKNEYHTRDPWMLLNVAEKQPEVLAKYLPMLVSERKNLDFSFDGTLEFIKEHPEYASKLYPVFQKYPELISSYRLRHWPYIPERSRLLDLPLGKTRISSSVDPEKILSRIERNKEIFNTLKAKYAGARHEEVIEGYPFAIPGQNIFDIADLSVFTRKLQGSPEDFVITLHPLAVPKDESGKEKHGNHYSFPFYEFSISEKGLVHSKKDFKDYDNWGYVFKAPLEGQDTQGQLDEKAIVDVLLQHDFGSVELREALETLPSVDDYLSRFSGN